MDVANLITNINSKFGSFFRAVLMEQYEALYSTYFYESFYLLLFTLIVLILAIIVLLVKKWNKREIVRRDSLSQGSRFRKRDKALFYGRKMLRKVRSLSGQVRNSGSGRKRKAVMKFARRILQLQKENEGEQLKVLEPPAEYLQEDLGDERIPSDLLYMFQSIRVFAHVDKHIFLKLCKHFEVVPVPAGTFLFKVGEPDENIFIVEKGKFQVYLSMDGSMVPLKIVKSGESIASLLSFVDVLNGFHKPYKTVCAKAIEDSTVLRLPMSAFEAVFKDNPEVLIRVIQVIMVRLQRVTFTALHEYLGLSAELIGSLPRAAKKPSNLIISPSKKLKDGQEQLSPSPSSSNATMPIPVPATHSRQKSKQRNSLSNTPDMIPDERGIGIPDVQSSSFADEESKRKCSRDYIDIEAAAIEAFQTELQLKSETLRDSVEIREVSAGTYLMKEESNKDVALVYVLTGGLVITQRTVDGDHEVSTYTAYPGEFVGGLAVLTGEPSNFSVRAKHASRIALISKTTFYHLLKEEPKVVLNVANIVIRRLSPFVRQIDFALDWIFLEAGRAVYRQCEESDSTFVVLSGRLRSVITHGNTKKELVAEYGRSDLLGIVEMVTHTPRSTTVIAVRDTELAKLPEGLFNVIKLKYPIVVTRLINILGMRILGSWQKQSVNLSTKRIQVSSAFDSRPSQLNFTTIAIVPVSDDVPLTAFTFELYHCLQAIGHTARLTSETVKKALGSTIMDMKNEYLLTSWLAQQEDQHKICLYQCDNSYTIWTQRCIRQADCILIVGLGDKEPSVGKMEREIERVALRTQKELVLLHREASGKPQNTVGWLNSRSWVSSHHHILCPKRMFSRKSLYRINELYVKVCLSEPNIHSDFSRLARWLTGKSVGLVLGGGGARGSAHVGMIKAIIESGIPIDMVGGVSIGAFMGALWCKERNITTVTQMAREWSKKMTQWWRQILDLTYPMTSMFSGRDFNATIRGTFGDTYIEDLWLPYFTITTDITASCMRVHSHGSLWRYVRASMSLSGYMPPLCDPVDGHLLLDGGYVNNLPGSAWRYVRASMTYVGIFPPLCDPCDGHFLVDGCYINNVPADVMRSHGASHILAVDVGSVDDQDLTNYGDDLSGWWLLWKRWNPFAKPVKVPNLPDIQSRLAYVSCVRQLEEVKNSDYCEYIRPPIDKYKTLQFGSFDDIKEVGYQHGKAYFEGKKQTGQLPSFEMDSKKTYASNQQRHKLSSYTFTDLAQIVCTIQKPPYDEDDDSDDYNQGYTSEPSVGIEEANREGITYGSLSENDMPDE